MCVCAPVFTQVWWNVYIFLDTYTYSNMHFYSFTDKQHYAYMYVYDL